MEINYDFPQNMRSWFYELVCLYIIVWDVCLKTLYGEDIDMRSYMFELFFHMYWYIKILSHTLHLRVIEKIFRYILFQ